MKLYRFSPIKDQKRLDAAIKYIHETCHKLCYQIFNEYLPTLGNIRIFCHYDEEYETLTQLQNQLTDKTKDLNHKYYRLLKPIVIPAKDRIPEGKYEYFGIRKPDPYRPQVGYIDFVLDPEKYEKLKKSLAGGELKKGVRIFARPEDDMLEIWDPDIDTLGYVVTQLMQSKNQKEK